MNNQIKSIKQNAKLITKHVPKDIFEIHKVVKTNITLTDDLVSMTSNLDIQVLEKLNECFADENVYTCEISINNDCIYFNFRRRDWRGDEDLSSRIKVYFSEMNEKLLNYTYDILVKFINQNIDTIYKSVEKKKRKKKIEKFKLKNVA